MAEIDDMTPVTRGELREDRSELRKEVDAKLDAIQAQIDAKIFKCPTNEELDKALGTWAGALMARMDEKIDQKIDEKFKTWQQVFLRELARHIRAIEERMRVFIASLDDKYKDLPGRVANLEELPARVTRLETAVFPPKRKRR